MADALPQFYLVRHGETAWSLTGRHTGLTDVPLTARGREAGRRLSDRLDRGSFSQIWSSPSSRAFDTCREAGFVDRCTTKGDLHEWNYGTYEGWTTAEILAGRPTWKLFRDGCPNGELPDDVRERADRIVRSLRQAKGNILIFSSSHILRVIAARWLGLPPESGASFVLGTASISILGYEHDRTEPVIRAWNDQHKSDDSNERLSA